MPTKDYTTSIAQLIEKFQSYMKQARDKLTDHPKNGILTLNINQNNTNPIIVNFKLLSEALSAKALELKSFLSKPNINFRLSSHSSPRIKLNIDHLVRHSEGSEVKLKENPTLEKSRSLTIKATEDERYVAQSNRLQKTYSNGEKGFINSTAKLANENNDLKKLVKSSIKKSIDTASQLLFDRSTLTENKRVLSVRIDLNQSMKEKTETFPLSAKQNLKISTQKSLFSSKHYNSNEDIKMRNQEIMVSAADMDEMNNNVRESIYDVDEIPKPKASEYVMTDTQAYFFKETFRCESPLSKKLLDDDDNPDFEKTCRVLQRSIAAKKIDKEIKKVIETNLMIARINKEKNDRMLRQTRKQEEAIKKTLADSLKIQKEEINNINQKRIQKVRKVDERIKKIKQMADNRTKINTISNRVVFGLIKTKMVSEKLSEYKIRRDDEIRTEAVLKDIRLNHQPYNTAEIQQHIQEHDKCVKVLTHRFRKQREKSVGKLVKKPKTDLVSREASLKKEIDALSKRIKMNLIKKSKIISEKVTAGVNNVKVGSNNVGIKNAPEQLNILTPQTVLKINDLNEEDKNTISSVLKGSKRFVAATSIPEDSKILSNKDNGVNMMNLSAIAKAVRNKMTMNENSGPTPNSQISSHLTGYLAKDEKINQNRSIPKRVDFENIPMGVNCLVGDSKNGLKVLDDELNNILG